MVERVFDVHAVIGEIALDSLAIIAWWAHIPRPEEPFELPSFAVAGEVNHTHGVDMTGHGKSVPAVFIHETSCVGAETILKPARHAVEFLTSPDRRVACGSWNRVHGCAGPQHRSAKSFRQGLSILHLSDRLQQGNRGNTSRNEEPHGRGKVFCLRGAHHGGGDVRAADRLRKLPDNAKPFKIERWEVCHAAGHFAVSRRDERLMEQHVEAAHVHR